MSHNFKLGALAFSVGVALSSGSVFAAETADDAAEKDDGKVVVLGSRAAPRSVSDSPVPIDLISGDEFVQNPDADLLNTVSALVPSFNVNAQPISDAATLVRPANMRGLPPDSTLVLVNGKRRHRSAVIAFLGAGLSDGSQGPDISVIPSMAIQQVEVLRDGAAAQYGSDAIAGVMNFVLKDDNSGGTIQVRMGEYKEGDGDTLRVTGNFGVPLTERGFVNVTYQFKEVEPTSRSVQRADAQGLIDGGNTAVANPAQIWGTPDIRDDITIFVNAGLELDNDKEAYMFGNYSERDVEGGFFYRNPNTRGGVFNGGNGTILTGDLDPNATDNSACGVLNASPTPAEFAAWQTANPTCWAFNGMFPGGFTPRFGGDVIDTSITMGVKGYFENGIGYDFSGGVGRSEVIFKIKNTINPSMGPDTPTQFRPGSYIELDKTFNADFTQEIQLDGYDFPLNLSYGYEYKHDTFEIVNGDKASFTVGPLASQGFGIGSNGFPGFKPEDAGKNSRDSHAVYLDAELQVTEDVLIGAALRAEDYSDFGNTLDGKMTTQIAIDEQFSFRASVSTGFRAPTVGQSNVRNVTTAFGPNGLEDQATLPPTNAIALQKGSKPLTPEESEAFSFGFVAEIDDLFMTLDFYRIDVSDRISQSANFNLTQADIDALLAIGENDASSFSAVKYFTNDFDTRTEGVDFVANYSHEHWGGLSKLSFIFSYVMTDVTDSGPSIDDLKKFQLESTLPKYRNSLTWNHEQDNWNFMARMNYYGEFTETHLDDITLKVDNDSKFTFDAQLSYLWDDELTISVGAQNLLDEYPERNPYDFIVGAEYSLTAPYGFNGAFYYAEVTWKYE